MVVEMKVEKIVPQKQSVHITLPAFLAYEEL